MSSFVSSCFVLIMCASLSSCAQFFLKEKTYKSLGGGELNGAQVVSAVKPAGGKAGVSLSAMVYNAGFGETDGPFHWRIEAVGQEGLHQSLTVHDLRVATQETGRAEPYPKKWLNVPAPFEPMKGRAQAGKVFAKYQLPGKLEVFPERDGNITLVADISIRTTAATVRRKMTFEMKPSIARDTQNIFVPTEIVKSFGKDDPTEWDLSPQSGSEFSDDFWGPNSPF